MPQPPHREHQFAAGEDILQLRVAVTERAPGLLTGTGLAVPTLYIAGSGTVPVRADRRDAVQMEGRANGPH
jgi:hypothetical protein